MTDTTEQAPRQGNAGWPVLAGSSHTMRATERTQLRHSVAVTIRELIVSGQMRPGELLRLTGLAQRMDMSITPVREALLLLAQDGWVIQEPNRGFRVAPIRRADVEDTYVVQAFLAGELAARAARLAMPADITSLRGQDAAIRALRPNATLEVEQANYALHQTIYDSAQAPRLNWFLVAAAPFVPRQFWGTIPGWNELNRAAHTPIIDVIERGDSEAARAMLSAHILAAEELLLTRLDEIGFWN